MRTLFIGMVIALALGFTLKNVETSEEASSAVDSSVSRVSGYFEDGGVSAGTHEKLAHTAADAKDVGEDLFHKFNDSE
ncbi:MAG: hypothetical protein WD904_07870 [Dehalococcoidia bacterium]